MHIVLWLSAGLAGLSAIATDRLTAWPLLASLLLCMWLRSQGIEFNPDLWTFVDASAILTILFFEIVRKDDDPSLGYREIAVIALFPVAWGFYYGTEGWIRAWGSWAVVVTQLLATVDWKEGWMRVKVLIKRQKGNGDGPMQFVPYYA